MGCTPSKNPNQVVVDSQFRPLPKSEERQTSKPSDQDKNYQADQSINTEKSAQINNNQSPKKASSNKQQNHQKPARFRPKSAGIPFSEPVGLTLTYEKASQLSPESPDEMWAIVNRTSEREGIHIEPTKNRKGWRTIRLFVSSTFKDFHPEREVLVKEVGRFFITCRK